MKLVEILAKELGEWPESAVCITQDSCGSIYGWEQAGAEYRKYAWYSPDGEDFGMHDIEIEDHDESSDHKKSVVSQAQWQAERERQKGCEWKRHRGGKQPVADDVRVEVKLRDGDIQEAKASAFLWNHSDCDVYANIMQYRIISQPQAEEVEVIEPISTYKEFEATGQWHQIDGPLAWRDRIIHCQAIIEDCEREIERNTQQLAAEGFELIALINSNLDQIDAALESVIDMWDWRNWKRGDVIEMIADDWCDISRDERYTIISTNDNSFTILDDCDDKRELSVDEETVFSDGRIPDFKFIKRG